MKFLSSLAFVFFTMIAFGQTTKKAFFIGNSYTHYNTMPAMVNSVAQSRGNTLIHASRTPDGELLSAHVAAPQTTTLMNSNTWDFVIIQAQSQEGAYPSSRFATDVMAYGTQLATQAKNIGATPLFYRTWGRKNGDSFFCPYAGYEYYCTYEGMDDQLEINYRLMAETNQSWLGPVGNVFRYLRASNPEIELFNPDQSHPSLSGSYAAALTFYSLMFNDNPELVTFNSTISTTDANAIKAAVRIVVFDNMAEWTSVGASDNIISVSAPKSVSPNDVVNVQVNYSASQSRDVVVVFREKNTPFTSYGESRATVNSGSGFIDINVTINAGTPIANNAYEFLVYLVPVGQATSQSLDIGVITDVSCVDVVIPTVDEVTITSAPTAMASGGTYEVLVDYAVTQQRDVRLVLQYVGPTSIVVNGITYNQWGWPINLPARTVSAGTGTLIFNISVHSSYPQSTDLHHWVSWITNVGGGYTESIAPPNKKFGVDIDPSLSVSDITNKNQFRVYPNPVENYLKINIQESDTIQILSIEGKVLLETKVNMGEQLIDISNLAQGLYVVKSTNSHFKSVKFIKK